MRLARFRPLAVLCATLAAAALTACAPLPRPDVLKELERIREGAAVSMAKAYAADAFAHAEKLRALAEAAMQGGDIAGADILGERSIAAYSRAVALARIARAEAEGVAGRAARADAEIELQSIDADLAYATADANAAELRVKVVRDAVPIQPSGRADPERERARMEAARALTMEGRILCGAAQMLLASGAPKDSEAEVATAGTALDALEKTLADTSLGAAPIDEASRVRAGCLDALTRIRRTQTPVTRALGAGDALLAEISGSGHFTPSRDERGVVIPLRNVFGAGSTVTPPAEARIVELGRIAAMHPSFPVAVVVHTDRPVAPRDRALQTSRGEAVIEGLKKAGMASKALLVVAGSDTPIADPHGPRRSRNERVEILFVTPEMF
jgi:flagellar motor protein MotB